MAQSASLPVIVSALIVCCCIVAYRLGAWRWQRRLDTLIRLCEAEAVRDENDYARTPEERAMLRQIREAVANEWGLRGEPHGGPLDETIDTARERRARRDVPQVLREASNVAFVAWERAAGGPDELAGEA